tara:strand:+ start:85 stop:213 length:129 start_codon:yes stop_codon:yes gene_type:complete
MSDCQIKTSIRISTQQTRAFFLPRVDNFLGVKVRGKITELRL